MSIGCYIPLRGQGGELRASVLVDREDAVLCGFTWCLNGGGYAVRPTGKPYLHRVIMHAAVKEGQQVDHINRDKLDCRRANLRAVTQAENARNVGLAKNNPSGYRGVSKHVGGKWRARVGAKHLGLFDTAEAADCAARGYRLVHYGSVAV